GDQWFLLTDVFYLSASEQSGTQLIKRGSESQGPKEPMIIPRGQILFIENLRDDGDIVTLIKKFKSGQLPVATPVPATPTVAPSVARSAGLSRAGGFFAVSRSRLLSSSRRCSSRSGGISRCPRSDAPSTRRSSSRTGRLTSAATTTASAHTRRSRTSTTSSRSRAPIRTQRPTREYSVEGVSSTSPRRGC